MGANIKQLRTRIKSVSSTRQLTKAMGLVASSKIRKANTLMNAGREYVSAVRDMVNKLASSPECEKSPYMRCGSGVLKLIVIAGDRGLAGGYNANVFRLMREFPDAEVIPIGKRACERFQGEARLAETFSYSDAKALSDVLCAEFREGKFDRLGIVYTKYHSMMSQEPEVLDVLPLEKTGDKCGTSVIFEPDELTILNEVIPEYVAGALIACVRESVASEVAARRVAMDAADKNAQQMLSDLNLAYNRARQGAITQEITEIIAGSGL